MSRRLAREAAFKALFQIDLGKSTTEQALRYVLQGLNLTESEARFAREIVEGTYPSINRVTEKHLVTGS